MKFITDYKMKRTLKCFRKFFNMKNRKNFTFMAFSAGQESKDAAVISRYIGVGSVNVIAINPNKAQLNDIFGIELDEEPIYTGTQDQDGKKVEFARLDVVLQTVPELNDGIETKSRMSLFVRNQYRFNRDQTKVQVIDKYGRTAWVTNEELKTHAIPVYSNGQPANIDADYRPCFVGEEDLTNFFKAFLNIPSPMVYKNKKWVPADNLDLCQARFDSIPAMFKGDFSEFVGAWKMQQNNKVKVLFGIRTTDEGKQYQTFYTKMFLRNSASNYDRLEQDVKSTKEAGGMPTSEFQIVPLQEYVVNSTPLENSQPAAADPFGNPAENPFFKV